ncbi:hypothetical protein ACIBCT_29535 [Streptosporangium sp. NPDC050855]|uniref:hypothetical protein n=1 Tax=Streptosporangium sp. NPDC050855 TaxID=3366194 RepID=UPI0037948E3D
MGISIYYTARRDRELDGQELDRVSGILLQENAELFERLNRSLPGWKEEGIVPEYVTDAGEICEEFGFYGMDGSRDPGVVLEGSTKVSHGDCGIEPMLAQLEHYMGSTLGRLRSALPGTEWDVHVDDQTLIWDEESGEYAFTS